MRDKVNTFLKQYGSVRKRTMRLIMEITPSHLNFTYKKGKFTVADQLRHIAAIERYLYAEIILGSKSKYKGCGVEIADGYDNIIKFINRTHSETLEIIRGLTDKDLDDECITPTGYSIKKGKWLELLIEHEIHHRAEIYLYLNLLEIDTPPIFGLTAEEVEKLSK